MSSNYVFLAMILTAVLIFNGTQANIVYKESLVDSFEKIKISIPKADGRLLHVYALPIDQGDCTIIQCPNGNIAVIDCGSMGANKLRSQQIRQILSAHEDKIKHIIITHPDKDHFNHLCDVIPDKGHVDQVIIGGDKDKCEERDPNKIKAWLKWFWKNEKLYTVNEGER